jgi:chloride channel protein, CIC family
MPETPRQNRVMQWLESVRRNETQLSLVLSLIIGALVGLVVVAFILLTGRLAARMYPAGGSGWRRILVPTIGSLLTGYLLNRYFPFARGSGIPQTKFALFVSDGVMYLRTVIGKFACCTVSLASGIALGREGPSVQVGAGIASVLAQRLGLSRDQVKSLVPVGCSAALAAAFNTPIAAVLFSLEEILGDLHAPVLGAVVLSSATSWMVLHLVLGDEPLFHVPAYHLAHPVEFAFYAVLGVAGGFGSVLFVKLLLHLRAWFAKLPKSTMWLQPVAGGLGVGLLGYFVPDVLGIGYNYVERVLNGNVVLEAVALLAILKIIATSLCYASGNAGGIFGPSLFIGAMLGAAIGSVAHSVFPGYTADPGAYALVGMGTAFAGIVRTPLTSVIMIFEVTRDYTIIVPLMISNLIAFFISYQLQREPIYEALAHQDGVHLPKVEHRAAYGRVRVATVMRPAPLPFTLSTTVKDAVAATSEGDLEAWPVADQGRLLGMISLGDLQLPLLNGAENSELRDLASFSGRAAANFPHLHPDHTLSLGLERMGAAGVKVLPIVSRADVRELLGVVTLEDTLRGLGIAGNDPEED